MTVIDNKKYLLVNDRHILYEARESDNDTLLYEEVGDYVIGNSEKDNRWYAIKEVLYNIASDNDLVYAILSGTIGGNVDFSNYLEIYKRGCDYAIGEENIVIYVYKK